VDRREEGRRDREERKQRDGRKKGDATRKGSQVLNRVNRAKRGKGKDEGYHLLLNTRELFNFDQEMRGERRVSENGIDF